MREEFIELMDLLQKPALEALPVHRLRALSWLLVEEQHRAEEVLPALPVALRRRLARSLADTAEADVTVNFSAALRILVNDSDSEVRLAAVEGLWEDMSTSLVPVLIRLLQEDPSAEVRAAAAISLGRFAMLGDLEEIEEDIAKTVHDVLMTAYHSGDDVEVRRRALESVSCMGGDDVVAAIEQAYQHPDERMTVSAVFAMGHSYDPRWQAIVQKELKNPRPEIRYEAARAAGELELEDALPILLDMIDTEDVEIRQVTIEALGKIGGKRALEALLNLVQSADEATKWAAVEALETARFSDDPLSPGLGLWLFDQGFVGDDWYDDIDDWYWEDDLA